MPATFSKFSSSVLIASSLLAGCAATAPTKIGADTWYSSKINAAGAFGDPAAIAGELMANGYAHCEAMGKEFELVTQETRPVRPLTSMGGASITFKCVTSARAPVMRPDQGVTTIEHR
jgi:hypothetical protein